MITIRKASHGAALAAVMTAGLAALQPAAAITYSVTAYEKSVGAQFDATLASRSLFTGGDTSTATFTYNGPLSFSNTGTQNTNNTGDITSTFFGSNVAGISGYTGTGPTTVTYGASGANFLTQAGFLNTSGSIAGYGYGSFYTFVAATGNYGGTNLTITHDDGVSVYAGSSMTALPGTTAGPTSVTTETVTLPTGTTSFTIAYGRENGSPSILQVAVPEPASLALLGAGLMGVGFFRRRRGA